MLKIIPESSNFKRYARRTIGSVLGGTIAILTVKGLCTAYENNNRIKEALNAEEYQAMQEQAMRPMGKTFSEQLECFNTLYLPNYVAKDTVAWQNAVELYENAQALYKHNAFYPIADNNSSELVKMNDNLKEKEDAVVDAQKRLEESGRVSEAVNRLLSGTSTDTKADSTLVVNSQDWKDANENAYNNAAEQLAGKERAIILDKQ